MSGAGHIDGSNKKTALLIAVLALLLAIAETLAGSAQTQAIGRNIEASNLWSFFQAKTIRMTTLRAAADGLEAQPGLNEQQAALVRRWRDDVSRYDSEPASGEGRKELSARAKAAETQRDRALGAHHLHELGSAAAQIGIVLASASVIVSLPALVWASAGFGAVGAVLVVLGVVNPLILH